MPSRKSRNAGSVVAPIEPKKARGGRGQSQRSRKQKSGKHGFVRAQPYKPGDSEKGKDKMKAWIEIQMVDEESKPVTGMAYRITLPDDSVAERTLDDNGFERERDRTRKLQGHVSQAGKGQMVSRLKQPTASSGPFHSGNPTMKPKSRWSKNSGAGTTASFPGTIEAEAGRQAAPGAR